MEIRTRFGLLTLLAVALAAPAAGQVPSDAAAAPAQKPDAAGVPAPADAASAAATPELIARGDEVYHGPGNCYACHGSKATGSVGPDLTDAEWIHSKGSYDDLVAQISAGITTEQSKSGIPMPANGGGSISEDDVKAVAAYVYSLRQK